jgi:polyphosphate kinase
MDERTSGFDLAPDGTWHRRTSTPEVPLVDMQETVRRRLLSRPE